MKKARRLRPEMIKEEAIALQAAVDEVLALAVEKKSEIGGAVNWGDLLCLDVEVSLLDGIVTVTVEGAAPEAVELCRFVRLRGADTAGSRSARNSSRPGSTTKQGATRTLSKRFSGNSTPTTRASAAAQLTARPRGIVSSPAGFKAGLEWKSQGHRAD
jgi:hypothetical protein